MNIQNKSVAIVILCWNDPINTFELINSIMMSSHKNFDIFLVDNNSDQVNFDNLVELIQKKKFNYKIIIDNDSRINWKLKNNTINLIRSREVSNTKFAKNLGVSKGYNKGLNLALKFDYEYIVKLDCDFIISENLLSGLIETFENNKYAVAVSPKVYYFKENKKTSIIWWKGVNFTKNYFRFQKTGKGASRKVEDIGQFKGIHESEGICGCCVMLKSSVLKQTGTLDEDFFFGPEDIEHSFRLRKFGKILINLDYYAYHKVSQSLFISGWQTRIYFETIGWLTLIRKVCSKQDKIIGYIFFLLRGLLHLLRLAYKRDKRPHKGFLLGIKDYFLK